MSKTIYAPGAKKGRATALAWVGKSFKPGYCLYFQLVHIYRVPGLGDYDHNGRANCADYWKAAKTRGKVVATSDPKKIPAGALIIWSGGSHGDGHAAYALGGSKCVSTDLPDYRHVGKIDVDLVRARWGLKLEGYVVVDGNGFTLRRPASIPKPVKATTRWKVTTKAGLIGRTGPSTKSRAKGDGHGGILVRPRGHVVKAVATITAGGYTWAITSKDTYYATKYMKKLE